METKTEYKLALLFAAITACYVLKIDINTIIAWLHNPTVKDVLDLVKEAHGGNSWAVIVAGWLGVGIYTGYRTNRKNTIDKLNAKPQE